MKKHTILSVLVAICLLVTLIGSFTGCEFIWPKSPTFTVSFAGGDGATGTAPTVTDKQEGEVFTLPENTFEKEGHSFIGWSDGETTYQAGAEYTMPAKNVSFTALWEALPQPTYTITYSLGEHPASGVATPSADTGKHAGDKLTLPAAPAAEDGYAFIGWSDGETTYQAGAEYTMPAENVSFTALWEALPQPTYTVTYSLGEHPASGVATPSADTGKHAGDKLTLPAAPAAEDGYIFDGWSDGKTTYQAGAEYTVAGDATLTALWKVHIPEMIEDYKIVQGQFVGAGQAEVKSASGQALAVNKVSEFVYGTLEIDIYIPASVTTGDHGIVFALTESSSATYWEGNGSSYYFFFIDQNNNARLGKTGTSWQNCSEKPISGFTRGATHTLKVEFNGRHIKCYVDGVEYIDFIDNAPLSGTKYGFRAAAADIAYSNVKCQSTDTPPDMGDVSEDQIPEDALVRDYTSVNGMFSYGEGNKAVSVSGNSIAIHKTGEFVYGTLEATMSPCGNRTDNGIIFSLSSNGLNSFWETGVSYYFFFLSTGGTAYLGKVDGGTWTACQVVPVPGYNENNTYTLKVEKTDSVIYCYVNGESYIAYQDDFPLEGTGYGLRAGASGVEYSSISCASSGTVVETYPEDIETVSGKLTGSSGSVKSSANESLGLLKDVSFTSGSFSASVKGVSTKRSGLIFGYSNDGGNISYYRFVTRRDAQKVEIDKVVNGVVTNIYSNYLSAGYSTGVSYELKVVIKEGKAYCYFWNTLYTVFDMELDGTGAGLYAEGPATQFTNYKVSSEHDIVTVDTLLFGHSYFELWSNYRSDFAPIAQAYSLGTYTNIGIGGSVAAHWELFKEALVAYEASQAIYMIGINDLTGGTSPASVVASIESTLLYMKNAKPELQVVLLSVNHCPARSNITEAISQTNVLMQQLCAEYDWIAYAEMEYAFCDNGTTPDSYWFTDGLHPSASGYTQKIVPAIENALKGLGQPELDEEAQQQILANAKELKKGVLIDYSEYSYRSAEWESAKPYYDQAIALIDACESKEEVEALDLSSLIASLDAIKRNTDYVYDELVGGTNCDVWETGNFTAALNSSTGGVFNVTHDGHRLTKAVEYTDMSFTFGLNSDNSAQFPTVGVMFRAKQTSALGIQGYFINIVTEPNYIQIWYFDDAYGTGKNYLEYIGGWVFPGEVENTTFRAIIEGDMCYIYTESDYQTKGKDAYGCSADLSFGGRFTPWDSGYLGILSWNSATGASGTLSIDNISGKTVAPQPEPQPVDKTEEIVSALTGSENIKAFVPEGITGGEGGVFGASGFSYKLYTGLELSDFSMTVKAESAADVGIAGFMFRCKPSATGDGIDGYLFNYVSNATNQFIQIFYLTNCYNTTGAPVVCDYIGGWVYNDTANPDAKVLGTTFDVTVSGNNITVSDGARSIGISLTGAQIGASYTPYTSGGIGVLSWQEGSATLTLSSVITKE